MNKSRAPILVVFVLAVLAIVGFTWWTASDKSGDPSGGGGGGGGATTASVTLSMVYSTEKKEWLEGAHAQFSKEHPEIAVELVPMGSLSGSEAILDGKVSPTVFSPADSLVLNLFASDWDAKNHGSPFVPGTNPEPLLITPLVFAAWEDRGELLAKAGNGHIGWTTIHDALVNNQGWPSVGGAADWGFVKFGHTDPTQSNSGLQALTLMAMDFHGRPNLAVADVLDAKFQTWMEEIERGVPKFEASTGTFMTDMIRFGPSKYDISVVYESLAISQIENAQGRWGNLRVYYPARTLWSDHPLAILANGATPEQIAAAKVWTEFLRSEPMQQRALSYGFRPGNPAVAMRSDDPNNPFTKFAPYGVQVDIPPVAPPPDGPVVRNLMTLWSRTVPRH